MLLLACAFRLVLATGSLQTAPAPLPIPAAHPDVPADTSTLRIERLRPIVVTATRSARALEDVPVSLSVIPAEAIAERAALRLSDLLAEQPGLAVLAGIGGAGLQVQGFDPDYTLILLDGQPVVGRTAGTLDLDRLAVSGVDRVEVVRGPLSARYGSEALAGVVNLVPRRPGEAAGGRLSAQVGSHGTSDVSAQAETGTAAWGVRAFLNRYGSDGFSLRPETGTLTVPAFSDHTAELIARLQPTDRTEASLHARLAVEDQQGAFRLGDVLYHELTDRADGSLQMRLRHRFAPGLSAEGSAYGARFVNASETVDPETGALADATDFRHDYAKAEASVTWTPTARTVLHAGAGVLGERVAGERYDAPRTSQQPFAFTEVEWMPHRLLDVVLSARYDAPSDYASRLTPNLAVLLRPLEALRLRASVGSGYRAPGFRQRYLVFTNAAGGYSVFGAEEARSALDALQAEGRIASVLIPFETFGTLGAETSVALGLGLEVEPVAGLRVRMHGFHNEVSDLIDTRPVAITTNGQQIFSYFNLARIYTRGVEVELGGATALPGRLGALDAGVGYQLLDTADRDALDAIDAGRLFRRDENHRDVRVTRGDYGGLFGRSRHSGTVHLTHRHDGLGLTTAARLTWRGRYGFADRNGNAVLDHPTEYASGYALLNLTLTKTLGAAHVQLGARNLLDHTDAEHLPAQPGRTVFGGVGYRF